MKILILCTGNSCRSQMAEGFLKKIDPSLKVFSAGTDPAENVHPVAIKVMSELDINISANRPKSVSQFIGEEWDFVITVCGNAEENCPVFTGKVAKRLHIGFSDPAKANGTPSFIESEFRRVRDEISAKFTQFYNSSVKPAL